jgi:hypothetical protein
VAHNRFAYAVAAVLAIAPFAVAFAADEPEKVTSGSGPASQGPVGDNDLMQNRASHIAGHIAFLKAELMITPAQEAAWDKVADAMRQDVEEYNAAVGRIPPSQTPPDALASLSQRAEFADLRARGERRFLSVFTPLYNSLSPQQKAAADDLFATRDDQ